MAADDLGRDRRLDVGQVEDARLGGELGVEDDLQPQVAELAGQLGRRAGLERVVDLVRLLEQVLAQRCVGLLAVPRAAVGLRAGGREIQGIAHGPATASSGATGREVERRRRGPPASSAPTVVPSAGPNRPTGWSAG